MRGNEDDAMVREFWRLLAICHTVMVQEKDSEWAGGCPAREGAQALRLLQCLLVLEVVQPPPPGLLSSSLEGAQARVPGSTSSGPSGCPSRGSGSAPELGGRVIWAGTQVSTFFCLA